ncbi:MAG: arylsulfatase [Planctomycetes bacterium B3_Pla]|nr:MAG: arylsulfatase [Planctomycetes bacterium B3_Pla]
MKDSSIRRRDFLQSAGFALGALLLPGCSQARLKEQQKRPPNIIYILADDMGYGDLACQNPESKIPTPNLDRLASEGVRFTDAHSPSAVCTPTRYGILTGRYCWRSRLKKSVLWPWDKPLIEADRLTVGKLLKDHGYDTACIGKWHLGWDWPTTDGKEPFGIGKTNVKESGSNVDFAGPIANGPTTSGFDYYFGTAVPNFPPYCFIENDRTVGIPTEEKPDDMFGCPGPMLRGWRLQEILPGLERKAVEYIDAKVGRAGNTAFRQTPGKPFFLYMPLTAPHTPIAPAREFAGKSQAGAYGDFVHQVDHVVGSVTDTLERNGFADNTLIIFTSDNGSPGRDGTNMNGQTNSVRRFGHNPSHIYRGIKADAWDGGHRVPFIARWPGHIKPASVSDETICHVDLMATCAAILGHELPADAGEDSYNILPALTGRKLDESIRQATVHHSISGMFAIRQGRWKLILGKGSGGWSGRGKPDDPPIQLYDMNTDASERKNVCREHPQVVERLTRLLEKYKEQGYSRPLS